MGQDIECPYLIAKAVEEEKTTESKETTQPDEGGMTIGSTTISGVRTYSIILMVMAVYCYLALRGNNIDALQELAFMICGYMFGAKVTKR